MMTPTDLESAVDSFRQWHAAHPNPRAKTPSHLQQQALDLLAHYPTAQVIEALGITPYKIRRWQRLRDHESPPSEFVALENVMATPNEITSGLHITLQINRGAQLSLSGSLSAQHLTALVQGLVQKGEGQV